MANKSPLLVIDIESTGLDPANGAEIVQLSGIALNPHDFSDHHAGCFNVILKPDHPETAHQKALDVIGPVLWEKAKKDGINQKVGLQQFVAWCNKANPTGKYFTKPILSGHNVGGFDVPFIKHKLFEYGVAKTLDDLPWSYHILDTVSIFFMLYESDPNVQNLKLDTFLEQLGIARETKYHDALEDVKLTAEVLKRSLLFMRRCRKAMKVQK